MAAVQSRPPVNARGEGPKLNTPNEIRTLVEKIIFSSQKVRDLVRRGDPYLTKFELAVEAAEIIQENVGFGDEWLPGPDSNRRPFD